MHSNLLLESTSPSIETWLPGETLFSLASRHHMLACNLRASDTCRQLFGHPRNGSAHDLPGCVGHFAQRSGGRFGSADEVLRYHTLLPYYLPFCDPQTANDAIAAMTGPSVGSLKSRLGILASRFGAAHPLKACRQCLREDRASHYVAFWHVEHQLPGVWICPWHYEPLLVAQAKWMGIDRFGWILPSDAGLTAPCEGRLPPSDATELRKLAKAAVSLWSLPAGCHISNERLMQVYRQALLDQDLCTASGRIRKNDFGERIISITRPLRAVPELSVLPQAVEDAAAKYIRLVAGKRSTHHPIRHLVLSLALFGNWEKMWARYLTLGSASENAVPPPLRPQPESHLVSQKSSIRSDFLAILPSFQGSMRAAAEHFGISQTTAASWAASEGIQTQRRPKILKPAVKAKLIRMLSRGTDKRIAAENVGVSVQTVTTTLRTEVGLQASWRAARHLDARRKARDAWTKTAAKVLASTPKLLRDLQPAVFAWLYRNDCAWLDDFSSNIGKIKRSNNSKIDWDGRDIEMAQKVKDALLNWYTTEARPRLTIVRLCQLIPGLKARLRKLDRMPLTRAALSQVSNRKHKPDNRPQLAFEPIEFPKREL